MRTPPTACQGVVPPVTEPSHAVFLSYASQDVEAAQKICEALRAAGIEVFLDQSELRGGDAWDQKIRQKIHDCALFIPIVSQHTQDRLEGYFRHEWKLAIERTHTTWPSKSLSWCQSSLMVRAIRKPLSRTRSGRCSGHAYPKAIHLPHSSNG
jgi:TIR domain